MTDEPTEAAGTDDVTQTVGIPGADQPGVAARVAKADEVAGTANADDGTGGAVVEAQGVSRWGLPGVDVVVAAGELAAVTGPSLSGKTTLVDLLAGWARPDAGTVRWDGATAPPPWSYVAVVPQAFALLEELSVIENIELARRFHRDGSGAGTDRTDELLARLGLDRLRHRGAFEVSVGERQRTMVARALAGRPRLVLADEPVAHQDERHGGVVLDLLAEAATAGAAVLVATRDPDLLAGTATRTVALTP